MASFNSSDNESYSIPRKLDDKWVVTINPTYLLTDSEGRLTKFRNIAIHQISLLQLQHGCLSVFSLNFPDIEIKPRP